jgi:hypothetical protein
VAVYLPHAGRNALLVIKQLCYASKAFVGRGFSGFRQTEINRLLKDGFKLRVQLWELA